MTPTHMILPCLMASLPYSIDSFAFKAPNIVLINIDDLGWADLGCNGSRYYETPNIDQLKTSGVWFSQAYAGAANSAPSRACMLTGQVTPRHGIYTVSPSDRGPREKRKLISYPNRESLPNGFQILPQVLQQAGYQTFHVGKWHVTDNPLKCGMNINIAGNHSGHPLSYFVPYHNSDLNDGQKGEFLTDRLGNEAVELIRQANKDKPYFLYYATYAVHTPLQAPRKLVEKYKRKKGNNAHYNPVYAALVETMDSNVGKVLAAIKESGQEENTIVIFTSDNGGVYDISKQWPLRAGKGSFYEGGIRIPLIVYQPGKFKRKEITDVAVSQMDLFPTFMELAGIPCKELMLDGQSLVPILKKGDLRAFKKRALYWHFPAYLEKGNAETVDLNFRTRPVSVIRKGDWKLIENYEDGRLELYNLKDDLGEKRNLANACPYKRNELKDELYRWKEAVHAPCDFKANPHYTH